MDREAGRAVWRRAARVLLLSALYACGRTSPEYPGDLVLLGIDRCDGDSVQLSPIIRADRSDPVRIGFEVLVDGDLYVHGPYRLHYDLVDDSIGFASDPPRDDLYGRFIEMHGRDFAEEEGHPLAARRVGFVELAPFSTDFMAALRDLLEHLPGPPSVFALPFHLEAEIHGVDADGNSVCSQPTELDVAFCTSCPADAC